MIRFNMSINSHNIFRNTLLLLHGVDAYVSFHSSTRTTNAICLIYVAHSFWDMQACKCMKKPGSHKSALRKMDESIKQNFKSQKQINEIHNFSLNVA